MGNLKTTRKEATIIIERLLQRYCDNCKHRKKCETCPIKNAVDVLENKDTSHTKKWAANVLVIGDMARAVEAKFEGKPCIEGICKQCKFPEAIKYLKEN